MSNADLLMTKKPFAICSNIHKKKNRISHQPIHINRSHYEMFPKLGHYGTKLKWFEWIPYHLIN
ncbi:26940_t:CDS:2, partial [Gigaspora margarita]